jgi:hypothetical protein
MLLRLARMSPDSFRDIAEAWEINSRWWPQIMSGTIPQPVWETLADRALDEVGIKEESKPQL